MCGLYNVAKGLFRNESHQLRALNLRFWVVLPEIAALSALSLLDQGEPLSALRTVNQYAQQLGRISAGTGRSEPTFPVAS